MNKKPIILRKVAISFSLFISLATHGQEWARYTDSVFYYSGKNQTKIALDWNRKALYKAEVEFGKKSSEYIVTFRSLALLYSSLYQVYSADSMYNESLVLFKERYGINSKEYATTLNGYSLFLQKNELDIKASYILNQALKIYDDNHLKRDLDYANICVNIANVNERLGNYGIAEIRFLSSISIIRELIGENNRDYAVAINNYGLLLQKLGRYNEAKVFCDKSLEIRKALYGEYSPLYASSLINVASIDIWNKEYETAENHLVKAIEIYKTIFGESHPAYLNAINSLAGLYLSIKKFDRAESLYLSSLEMRKRTLGEKHSDYLNSLNNIGEFYLESNQFDKAESIYKKALPLCEEIFGKLHPNYNIILSNLSACYEMEGKYTLAYPLYLQSFEMEKLLFQNTQFGASSKEQERYFNKVKYIFSIYQSFPFEYTPSATLASNSSLFAKQLLLNNSKIVDEQLKLISDSSLIGRYNELRGLKAEIAKEYSLEIAKRNPRLNEFEKNANNIEKGLAASLSKIKGVNLISNNVSFSDIKTSLRSGESCIEFSDFKYFKHRLTDSIFYCAYIFNGNDTIPKQVFLFEERQIDSVLDNLDYTLCLKQECVNSKINQFYNWEEGGKRLYELIWRKLEPELKGVKTVYFSPSGKLHKIAFAAIPNTDSTLISDKYNLVQLSSTREIAMPSFKPLKVDTSSLLALFGGIKYDVDTIALKNTVFRYHDTTDKLYSLNINRAYTTDSNLRGINWNFLPGTLSEVEYIKLFYKNAKLFTYLNASEEAVKSLQGKQSPEILHLATHGFFFKEGGRKKESESQWNEFRFSQDPLIRSGLMMAGGNLRWKGEKLPAGIDDGILTAKEVSTMNLMNTKLVVLSACETGLGDIKGSEGVFGLQRAFKMAGVKYILMSLWTVPDEATKDFMQTFYSKLKKGNDIQSSFSQTQIAMRAKYQDPYDWAGFVLMR